MILSLQQIADQYNVSLSTLYRVLRGAGKTAQTQHRALRAALVEHGYMAQPEEHVGLAALVTPMESSPHAVNLYRHLVEYAECKNMTLVPVPDNDIDRNLRRHRFEGVISMSDCIDRFTLPIPVVKVNRIAVDGMRSSVLPDGVAGMIGMLRRLHADGYRRIGFFIPHGQGCAFYGLIFGFGNFEELYAIAGADYDPELICRVPLTADTHVAGCRTAADYFASLPGGVDAVILAGDIYAFRFDERFMELNRRICLAALDDVTFHSIEGLDAGDCFSALAADRSKVRELYYLEKPLREMAVSAVDLLLDHIRIPDRSPRRVLIAPRLKKQVIRFSS